MISENQNDPYDAVLADLHAKRDQIDQTIALLSSLRGGLSASFASSQVNVANDQEQAVVETAGMYLGMSIVDATKKLLALRKRTMTNSEILSEIKAGGLVMTGADPLNVVGSVMTRRFNQVGDVVRVGRGTWGLKEWYPGRNFKTSVKVSVNGEPLVRDSEGHFVKPGQPETNAEDMIG